MAKKPVKIERTGFMNALYEEFGEELVDDFVEKEENPEDIKRLEVFSTGSTSLDVSIGIGGIPRGRITTIYGPESAAKTTLCLSTAKNAIKETKVLYVDQEHSVDYTYINAIVGDIDTSRFMLVQPETAEQCLKTCEIGINSGEYGLVILDSVGALSPEKEKEDPFEKAGVGVIPRMLSKFLRRNSHAIKKNNVAFIFINQVRSVIGAYVPTLEMPGGHALRHFSSLILYLHRSDLIKFGDEVVGAVSKYSVKKNKVGIPFRSHYFSLMFGVGIADERDIIDFAVQQGILDKRGSYFFYQGEGLGQGVVKSEEYLKAHPEVLDKIKQACYNINSKSIEPVEVERSEDETGTEDQTTV